MPSLSRRAFLALCGASTLASSQETRVTIGEEQLRGLLNDPTTAEDALSQYFQIDNSIPFAPKFDLKPEVTVTTASGEHFAGQRVVIGIANDVTRNLRQNRYRERIREYPDRIRVVAQGDSWFQYPDPRVSDIVDQLFNYFNIFSVGSAGETLSEMFKANDYIPALQHEGARVLLLSGGGNDVLGHLDLLLSSAGQGADADRFLSEELFARIADVGNLYRSVFSIVSGALPDVSVVTHGYDYVIPRFEGPWLGPALRAKGATSPDLQRSVMRLIVDRMNETLLREAKAFASAHVVDLRGTVRANGWKDEIHPDNNSFQQVALRLQTAIANIVDARRSRSSVA